MTRLRALGSVLEALLAPGARQHNDRSVLEAQNVRLSRERLPPGLALEWLGTAGFRLSYEGFDLLVDPYVSRHGLRRTLGRSALLPDERALRTHVPSASAILVGHTHFDHALDVPRIAARHECRVYGSSSLRKLMGIHGLADRAVEVEPLRVYEIGPFEVTFVESAHARLIAGLAVPADGELSCEHLDELRGSAYRCGRVFGIHIAVAGATLYHQGSAEMLEGQSIHRGVDFLLAGIAGRRFSKSYTSRALSLLEPRVVIPHHFDDFFRPLGAEMGFSLNVNLGGFLEEVHRVSTDFSVHTLAPLQAWGGSAEPRFEIAL
jgi:L-ascorbate metabolism protein UlaG (beta-lactamase superfamily)